MFVERASERASERSIRKAARTLTLSRRVGFTFTADLTLTFPPFLRKILYTPLYSLHAQDLLPHPLPFVTFCVFRDSSFHDGHFSVVIFSFALLVRSQRCRQSHATPQPKCIAGHSPIEHKYRRPRNTQRSNMFARKRDCESKKTIKRELEGKRVRARGVRKRDGNGK